MTTESGAGIGGRDREEIEVRYIAAASTPGIGGATLKTLLVRFGTIMALWAALDRSDASASMRRIAGHWRTGGEADARNVRRRTLAVEASVCVWEDPTYPASLRAVSNPPAVLYVRGDIGRLSTRALALVGTTDPAPAFARVASWLGAKCAEYGIHVVSGLARGIDATALRAAAEAGVPSFAVVGHGIDYEYPASSRPLYAALARTGAVISQFPTGHKPQRWTFPMRNEVMCTLAYGTVIVQAHEKDGSLVQADFSFKHGRDVLIYQGNAELPDSEWLGRLEARGAKLFTSFGQVLDAVAERHEQFRSLREAHPAASSASDQLPLFAGEAPMYDPTSDLSRFASQALLVDIDGVVADTQETTIDAIERAFEALNIPSPARPKLRGLTPAQAARIGGITWPTFKEPFSTAFEAALSSKDVVLPEVVAVLQAARDMGWKLAAVTSQPRRRTMLTLKTHTSLFEHVITYNDTPRAPKPAPDSLNLALRRLGLASESALFVGDTHNDILAARAARVRSVAVLWGYEPPENLNRYSPDFVVGTADELADVLRQQRVS